MILSALRIAWVKAYMRAEMENPYIAEHSRAKLSVSPFKQYKQGCNVDGE